MTFDQIITILTIFGSGLGVLLGYAKLVAPALIKIKEKEADENRKQREHERTMQAERLRAEQETETNRWEQMVKLQNSQSAALETLLDFMVGLSTERLKEFNTERQDDYQKVVKQWSAVQHEMRELRANTSILVNEVVRQEEYRQQLDKLPQHLLTFQEQQVDLYREVINLVKNGKP